MPLPLAAFVLQGRSDFEALTAFNSELSICLRNLKIEPFLVNLLNIDESLKIINRVLQEYGTDRTIAAFSFSGIGMELGEGAAQGNVWQHTKIPFVSWMMDHPCYILKRNELSLPAIIRIYPTIDYVNFQRDFIKAPGRNIHCPMGVFTQGQEAKRREPRKGEPPLIVLAKSLGDISMLRGRWKQLPTIIQRMIGDAIDHYWDKTNRQASIVESVLIAGRAAGYELQNDTTLFSFLFSQVDLYIRWHKATLLIQDLMKLPVRIYGKGVDHLSVAGGKATLLRPINHPELMTEYRNALAVISMNPNSDNACHDRVYSAFGTGALPISDTNPWWEKTFPSLQPYSYDFCGRSVVGAVEKVLEDPQTAANVAWDVGLKMRTERPFQTVVKEVIDMALLQRYFEFNFVAPVESYVR